MFDTAVEYLEDGRVTKYKIGERGSTLSYGRVVELWQSHDVFRAYFVQKLLAESPFKGFRWESPPVSNTTLDRPFEFVLINTPGFATRRPDRDAYADYFTEKDHGVVTFRNLGNDATLVVPSPRADDHAYGHLAAFVRLAPADQIDALWRIVGDAVSANLSNAPLWLSTAGGGVAWLHVRLDSRPQYYGYAPYKRVT